MAAPFLLPKTQCLQAHLLFTRTVLTADQRMTWGSQNQQRWCRCPGEIPQPIQDNDVCKHESKILNNPFNERSS